MTMSGINEYLNLSKLAPCIPLFRASKTTPLLAYLPLLLYLARVSASIMPRDDQYKTPECANQRSLLGFSFTQSSVARSQAHPTHHDTTTQEHSGASIKGDRPVQSALPSSESQTSGQDPAHDEHAVTANKGNEPAQQAVTRSLRYICCRFLTLRLAPLRIQARCWYLQRTTLRWLEGS